MKVTIFKSTFIKSGANCIGKLQSVFKRIGDRGDVQLLFGVEREGLCKTSKVVDPYSLIFIFYFLNLKACANIPTAIIPRTSPV